MATGLTRQQAEQVLTTARDELDALAEQHPSIRIQISGARTVLATGLVAARRASEIVACGCLTGSARMASETLQGALERHPELAAPDSRVLDVAWALSAVASGRV